MIQQTPWVERKWNFDFPAGYYPCILERLSGTPARVKEMVNGIPDEKLSQRFNNKWSVKELIGHLIDLEELHEKRLGEFIDGKEILSAADMKNQKTEEANHNAKSIESLLDLLSKTRTHFNNRLRKADDELVNRISFHPRLQKQMRLVDMAFFAAEHDDHHIAKMRAIIGQP